MVTLPHQQEAVIILSADRWKICTVMTIDDFNDTVLPVCSR